MLPLPTILTNSGNAEIVEDFSRRGVAFLIVGGAAVAVHGCRDPDKVDDLDLMIDPSLDNTHKVFAALISKGISVPFSADALAKPQVQVPVKTWNYWLDILTPDRQFRFDTLFQRAIRARLRDATVRVAARSDLVALKELALTRLASESLKHERDLRCLRATA